MSARKAAGLSVRLTAVERKRVAAMAKRSDCDVAHWLHGAVMGAVYVDEAHWTEMAQRDAIRHELNKDRERFGRTTVHCRNIGDGAIDSLMDLLVAEREKGRLEGSASAKRLACVRPVSP